jgi:hypothetical protein
MPDGERIEYWRVRSGGDLPGVGWSWEVLSIEHWRATFYENTRWVDHPWSKAYNDRGGADFVNDWAIECEVAPERWHPDGRGTGYDWPAGSPHHQDRDAFSSLAEAMAAVRERSAIRIVVLKKKIAESEAALAALEVLVSEGL